MGSRSNGWLIEHSRGLAEPFHHRPIDMVDQPTVWIHQVDATALVLGSTQSPSILRSHRFTDQQIEVCTRRSGGGLVLIEPAESCWIDVIIPSDDPRWDIDVGRAFGWVGEVWQLALISLGITGAQVHDGPLLAREHGRFLCFAGLGPGEITVPTAAGRSKLVGLSQRRTRRQSRFQGLFVRRWNPTMLLDLVEPTAWPSDLDPRQVQVGLDPTGSVPTNDEIIAAVIAALPDA